MIGKPRWIQSRETRDRTISEKARLRGIIEDCSRGKLARFSTLELAHHLDSQKAINLIADTLYITKNEATQLFGKWDESKVVG